MSNLRRARLEGADQNGGSNRFCGGVVSAGLRATYNAPTDGTDPEMVNLNGPESSDVKAEIRKRFQGSSSGQSGGEHTSL